MVKTCSKCGEIKFLTDFGKDRKSRDGHRADCNICRKSFLEHPMNRLKTREASRKYAANNKEKIKVKNKRYSQEKKEKALLRAAKRRAIEQGLPFSIEESHITIPESCPVLGISIRSGIGKQVDSSPNLDRIIPELGYIPGNIRVISAKANRIKSNATAKEIKLVAEDLIKLEKDSK